MNTATIQKIKNGTVKRKRDYLQPDEVAKLIDAANNKDSRNSERNGLMITMAYNHALRVSELVNLEWQQINLKTGRIFVERVKHGTPSEQYLAADEMRKLKRLRNNDLNARFVFLSERRLPMTVRGFYKIVAQAGERAKLDIHCHPHILRHAKGFQLANRGTDTRLIQGYLGHVNIQHTVRYTALCAERFRGLEK
jgi:site-specific recombinase XerD